MTPIANLINRLRRIGNNDIPTTTLKSRCRRALWVFLPHSIRIVALRVFKHRVKKLNPVDSLMHFFAATRSSTEFRRRREFKVAGFFLAQGDPILTRRLFDFLKIYAASNFQAVFAGDERSSQQLKSEILPNLNSNQSASLAMGLASMGLFKSAYLARCDAMDKSELETFRGSYDSKTVRRAIHKHLDDGDIEGAKNLLSKIRAYKCAIPDGVEETLTAIIGSPTSNREFQSRTDEIFHKLVNNKAVLLVGAAPIPDGNLPDQSHYDCIVRITPTVLLNQEQSKILDRCDIAYLKVMTKHTLKKLESFQTTGKLKMLNVETPKLIVMKKAGDIANIADVPVRNVPNIRSIANESPTSGTQAITDILQFQPSRLDLVGFNFYTSKSMYEPDILEEKRQASTLLNKRQFDNKWNGKEFSITIHLLSWASHDLASDFMFVKAIVKNNNQVKPLGETAEVLGWSLEQYFNRFSELMQYLSLSESNWS